MTSGARPRSHEEIGREIVEAEMRTATLAATLQELLMAGGDNITDVEAKLWVAMDALTMLRFEQVMLVGLEPDL
jgi:hypothetical protein